MTSKKFDAYLLSKRQAAFDEVKQWIDQILEPQKWGFKESYRDVDGHRHFSVIYNSQWCRVRINEATDARFETKPSLDPFHYGRLHAPSEGSMMIHQGEECWAWWGKWFITLYFLEGANPQKAVEERPLPDFLKPYWDRVLQAKSGNAEAMIRMEKAIWEHYDVRFFELFDLRSNDLWEQYRKYVEEYYQIKGWKEPPSVGKYPFPLPWKIC